MDISPENPLVKKVLESLNRAPSVTGTEVMCRVSCEFVVVCSTRYLLDGRRIHSFNSEAAATDGSRISTASAKLKDRSVRSSFTGWVMRELFEENGLRLERTISCGGDEPFFTVSLALSSSKGRDVESRYLAPLCFIYPNREGDPLFLSLDQKMLLVPYDNDMWVRYESVPLKPGRTSYDVTCVYDENSLSGLLIGALDADTWKNAVTCSSFDARVYKAYCGVADAGTHDCCPHGALTGKKISSSRFLCGWAEDIRDALELYGKRAMEGRFSMPWVGGVPFGWNSYSALAIGTTADHWETAADFINGELTSFKGDGGTFINLDAVFGISRKHKREIVEKLHARGQKAGTYLAPLTYSDALGLLPLKGSVGKSRKSTVMKLEDGTPYAPIDGSIPVDITRPEVEKDLRLSLREIVEDGFDYLKIDFTSHGAVEGERFDKSVRTGRQALGRFYSILAEELDSLKIGRKIFVSLSIAPLFPAGYGVSRRASCDAFGHHEDVRYVLNALNFGWWTQGSLYSFNDPDHTVLYNSVVDGRGPADIAEARSRYYASVISGTVLLLSDNYGPKGEGDVISRSRRRALELANDPDVNAIARLGKPFRPVRLADGTCDTYYLDLGNRHLAAVFNFSAEEKTMSVKPSDISAPESGSVLDIGRHTTETYDGVIRVQLSGYDSAILELKAR